MAENYKKSTYDVNNTDWVPIIAPMYCNGFGLKSSTGTSFKIRTDAADVNTEDLVPFMNQEVVSSPFQRVSSKVIPTLLCRFTQGEVLCYAQSTVAHDQIVGTFVR